MATVDIQELKENASDLIHRTEQGEAISVTRNGRLVAQIVSTTMPPCLRALAVEGSVRPGDGSHFLPTPIKLRGSGPDSAHYVAESRR